MTTGIEQQLLTYAPVVTACAAIVTAFAALRFPYQINRILGRFRPKRWRKFAKIKNPKIYLSTPMSDINVNPEKALALARKVKGALVSDVDAEVFSALTEYYADDAPDGYQVDATVKMTKNILAKLHGSDAYVLVYLERVSTSSLIELGLAFAQKKRTVVFYKEGVIPWLLRPEGRLPELGYRLSLVKVTSEQDIVYEINKQKCELFD